MDMDIDYFKNEVYKNKDNRLRELFIKKNFIEFYNFISDNNKYDCSFLEKLYIFVKYKGICYCGNFTKFISFKKGYLEYCSIKCSSKSLKTRMKYEETCLNKYGVNNVSKSNDIKEKKEKTSLERYGVKTYLQTDECKDIILDKYGVTNIFESLSIKEKIKSTNLERYGNTCSLLSDEIIIKTKLTNLERYGVDHFSKTEKFKSNMKVINDKNYIKGLFLPSNYKFISRKGYLNILKHDDCGNEFEIQTQLIRLRKNNKKEICRICNKIEFHKENNFNDYIKSIYDGIIIQNYRDGLEIDIYLPELNIGFEFNGLYWHSELFKDKNYHINKSNYFKERNIRIIHIWEDDWLNKSDIIKSIVKSSLNIKMKKIYARSCKIKKLTDKESRDFLLSNHLQGWCVSKHRYGLIYNDEIVSIITIGKERINLGSKISDNNNNNNSFELLRYCNKINYSIIGGFTKILSNIKNDIIIHNLITYSDISIFNSDVYKKNGFEFIKLTNPGYYYLVNGVRKNRFNYTKSKLIKMGFNKDQTERKIMFNNKNYRIYDCGSNKFIYNFNI